MSINSINDYLARYKLFSFQHRVFYRLSIFSFRIVSTRKPINLFNDLRFNYDKKVNVSLRNKNSLSVPVLNKKVGERIFVCFFTKFINHFYIDYINIKFKIFKNFISNNLNNFLSQFTILFHKFDLSHSIFSYFKYCKDK